MAEIALGAMRSRQPWDSGPVDLVGFRGSGGAELLGAALSELPDPPSGDLRVLREHERLLGRAREGNG